MSFFTKFFGGVGKLTINLRDFFTSDKTAQGFHNVLKHVLKALPVVMYAAKFGARILTPMDPTDDIVLDNITKKFPSLFLGGVSTPDEEKLRMMLIAEDALRLKYPELSTTDLRILVNAVYKQAKESGSLAG